jgi:DNA-binding NarL/FixJ family response regulator
VGARDPAILAANGYRDVGFLPLAAEAFEIAGDLSVALRLFREMNHVSGLLRVRRRLSDGTAQGRVLRNRTGALSAREREIARLITAGNSNKIIARELQISEKTVEKHIACIFQKLRLCSRVQIAAQFAERTLPL